MNYHSDEWIMERMKEHYAEALNYFNEEQIVGIFYQGSGNYGLDYEESDVDTKLIVVPSFEDIAMNNKPISTTHVRANDEHIDFKDIRLYMQTFRKQNLNFLEILFTNYKIVNSMYEEQWNRLTEYRERIAHMNLFRAVKAMKGVAMEKYHAMEHRYPNKIDVIEKFGYDPKQLHHLMRVEDYLERYIKGEPFESCLIPTDVNFLKEVKSGYFELQEARVQADKAKNRIDIISENFCKENPDKEDESMKALLDSVQLEIMRIAIQNEMN